MHVTPSPVLVTDARDALDLARDYWSDLNDEPGSPAHTATLAEAFRNATLAANLVDGFCDYLMMLAPNASLPDLTRRLSALGPLGKDATRLGVPSAAAFEAALEDEPEDTVRRLAVDVLAEVLEAEAKLAEPVMPPLYTMRESTAISPGPASTCYIVERHNPGSDAVVFIRSWRDRDCALLHCRGLNALATSDNAHVNDELLDFFAVGVDFHPSPEDPPPTSHAAARHYVEAVDDDIAF